MKLPRDKGSKNKLVVLAAFFICLLIFSSDIYAGTIYIVYLQNGKNLTCLSVTRKQDTVECDADGLMMSINKSDIIKISPVQGSLSKQSAQSRIAGDSTKQQDISGDSTNNGRCAEILNELEAINNKVSSMSIGDMYTAGAHKKGLTNEYELRCMSASERQARQQDREIKNIDRKLDHIQQKQQEIQNTQRGIGY